MFSQRIKNSPEEKTLIRSIYKYSISIQSHMLKYSRKLEQFDKNPTTIIKQKIYSDKPNEYDQKTEEEKNNIIIFYRKTLSFDLFCKKAHLELFTLCRKLIPFSFTEANDFFNFLSKKRPANESIESYIECISFNRREIDKIMKTEENFRDQKAEMSELIALYEAYLPKKAPRLWKLMANDQHKNIILEIYKKILSRYVTEAAYLLQHRLYTKDFLINEESEQRLAELVAANKEYVVDFEYKKKSTTSAKMPRTLSKFFSSRLTPSEGKKEFKLRPFF